MEERFYDHVPHCYACGSGNPKSLGLNFRLEGGEVRASFKTGRDFEGPQGYVHGGLIGLLIDEAGAVFASARRQGRFMTGKLEVRFRRPVPVGETITVAARARRSGSRSLVVEAIVSGEDGTTVAEGTVWFIRFSEGKS